MSMMGRFYGLGIAILFLLLSSYVHQSPTHAPTAISRLDLLHSIVRGRVNIDAYHKNTPDKADYHGHYYSDKAPGTVALALPAFAASTLALKVLDVGLDSDRGWLISSWIACIGSIGIVTALGAVCLFNFLLRHVPVRHALITTLALFLGAAPLPYATMMFSHSLVVGLVAFALWASIKETESKMSGTSRDSKRNWLQENRWTLAAGFACGWILASEYTAGLVVIALFLWLVSHRRDRAVPFCLAAVPPLSLIPLYSWACFGSPFILPYSLNSSFPAMKEGLYAIKWPDPETAYNLLFSPARGLLFWTPFLLVAIFGYWQLIRTDRRMFWLTYAVPVLHIIVISGRAWDWTAGPTLGPRYLAPILPLLALPCALGALRVWRISLLLAVYSILLTTFATFTNACPVGSITNPLMKLHIPLFLKSEFSPNVGQLLGLPAYVSFGVFYCILFSGVAWLWLMVSMQKNGAPLHSKPPTATRESSKSLAH